MHQHEITSWKKDSETKVNLGNSGCQGNIHAYLILKSDPHIFSF